jgi:HK97 family phage major capsid protein
MTKKELDDLLAAHKAGIEADLKKKFASVPVMDEKAVASLELDATLIEKSDKPEVRKFQETCDDLLILDKIMKHKEGYQGIRSLNLYKKLHQHRETELKKALTVGGSTTGSEWIPTGYSSSLQTMIDQDLVVAAAFPSFVQSQNPYVWPTQTSHAIAYLIAEMGEVTASTPATGNLTFTAKKLATQIQSSYEMDEGSLIPVMPFVKGELAYSLAYGIDNAIMNGAIDNSIDIGNSTASDQRRACLGLRKLAIANAYVTDLSTFNSDTLNLQRKKGGKYFADPSKCTYFVSNSIAVQLCGLKDANNNAVVLTMDKLGQDATIKNGKIGKMFGSDVYTTAVMAENLNAAGISETTVTTYTGLMYVRLDALKLSTYGPVITESQRVIDYQYTKLVSSKMIAFMPMFAIASNHILDFGVKITA